MKKIFISCLLLALLIGGASSCQSDNFDSNFDENVTERTNNRIMEFKNELTSSPDGWKMTYFTDDTQLGGFTYLFDFTEDNQVTMISDFDGRNDYSWSRDPLLPKTTGYEVTSESSTVSLHFHEGGNYIHLLGNNSVFPPVRNSRGDYIFEGKGFMGVYQFLYYGLDSDGINLRTNRHHIDLKLERATAEDWSNLRLNRIIMDIVATKKTLLTIENGESMTYNFKYTKSTRFANVLSVDNTMSVNAKGGIGVGFTSSSIKISPAIEFEDGSSVSELVLDGNLFVGEANGNTVIIQ